MYKQWAECTKFVLTRCRRSDQAHFDFYCGLPQDVSLAIKKAKKRYAQWEHADLHAVISHAKRRKINSAMQQEACEGQQCVRIPSGVDPEFDCFPGTKLVGCANTGKFVNSAWYTVLAVGETILLEDQHDKSTFEVTPEVLSKNAMLAYAVTYHRLQGATQTGTLCLHGMDSKHFQRHHLYVGLSRVTHGENAYIAADGGKK